MHDFFLPKFEKIGSHSVVIIHVSLKIQYTFSLRRISISLIFFIFILIVFAQNAQYK